MATYVLYYQGFAPESASHLFRTQEKETISETKMKPLLLFFHPKFPYRLALDGKRVSLWYILKMVLCICMYHTESREKENLNLIEYLS
jgi:hypothetical protein